MYVYTYIENRIYLINNQNSTFLYFENIQELHFMV